MPFPDTLSQHATTILFSLGLLALLILLFVLLNRAGIIRRLYRLLPGGWASVTHGVPAKAWILSSEETGTKYGVDRKLITAALLVEGPEGDRFEAETKFINTSVLPKDTEVEVLIDPQDRGRVVMHRWPREAQHDVADEPGMGASPGPGTASSPEENISARLATAKRLFEAGDITEEEYREQRRRILSDI